MNLGDGFHRLISLAIDVKRNELRALMWSFFYFFALLTTFFILRPIRDAMGVAGGVENLPWLFTGTFLAMLVVLPFYGALVSRFPRRKFIPYAYGFFALNLMAFWYFYTNNIEMEIVARVFFVWMSVFNVFVVSIFWSFMVDLYKAEQSKRLFGFIAAGGTTGTILGESITAFFVGPLGTGALFFVSALVLLLAIICVLKLVSFDELTGDELTGDELTGDELTGDELTGDGDATEAEPKVIGGNMFDGVTEVLRSRYLMGICLLVIFLAITATFAYFFQANFLADNFEGDDERTKIFALVGLAVSTLTIITQVFIVGRVMKKWGVKGAIIILPIVTIIGFSAIAMAPTIIVFFVFQIFRRTAEYGTLSPARENLFSVLPREEKYKAKNFIDTVVFRGGDAASGWIFNGLSSGLGFGIKIIAMIGVVLGILWGILAWRLGEKHQSRLVNLREQRHD
jgi:AAA family ATP:ADP antiporter